MADRPKASGKHGNGGPRDGKPRGGGRPRDGKPAKSQSTPQSPRAVAPARTGKAPLPPAAAAVPEEDRRCGFVAIIGAPNAGKSTLVNMLVGAKVSIVSHKVQTTRIPVRGILIDGPAQIVLIDTPGIFAPKRRLDRAMVDAAWTGAGTGDRILLLVDAAKGLDEEVEAIIARLKDASRPVILVLNKVDRLRDKEPLLALAADISARIPVEAVFMIAALSGYGVADLKRHLSSTMPLGPWHYPEDELSDLPMRLLAAEVTRERIYHHLHDELPYAITVETSQWKDLRDGSARIEQTVFVEREGQRKIVLGKGGDTIKRISSEARAEIADMIERPVHLFVFVKVRERWGEDPERYRELGLEYPKE